MIKKFLLAIATAVALVLVLGGVKAAVNANHSGGTLVRFDRWDCSYLDSSVTRINGGSLAVYRANGRFYADVDFNDGSGREWRIREFKNGDLIGAYTRNGSWYIEESYTDTSGNDNIRWTAESANGKVYCMARAADLG
jgi:hypothetical protein